MKNNFGTGHCEEIAFSMLSVLRPDQDSKTFLKNSLTSIPIAAHQQKLSMSKTPPVQPATVRLFESWTVYNALKQGNYNQIDITIPLCQ